MATTVLDSVLFRDLFGTPRMREIFEERALIARYVEVEVALARAQGRCGVIPVEAAAEIAARANPDTLDLDLLRRETEVVPVNYLGMAPEMVDRVIADRQ